VTYRTEQVALPLANLRIRIRTSFSYGKPWGTPVPKLHWSESNQVRRPESCRRVWRDNLRPAAKSLTRGDRALFLRKLRQPQIVDNSQPLGDNLS
jgi:hypothetical protein